MTVALAMLVTVILLRLVSELLRRRRDRRLLHTPAYDEHQAAEHSRPLSAVTVLRREPQD